MKIEFPHLTKVEQKIIKAFVEEPTENNTDHLLKVIENIVGFVSHMKQQLDRHDDPHGVRAAAYPHLITLAQDTLQTLFMIYEVKRPDHHLRGEQLH